MSKAGVTEELKQKPFIIKEGTEYRYEPIAAFTDILHRMKVKFRIQVHNLYL